MVKQLDKWVHNDLGDQQKGRRFEICSSFTYNNRIPFFKRIPSLTTTKNHQDRVLIEIKTKDIGTGQQNQVVKSNY